MNTAEAEARVSEASPRTESGRSRRNLRDARRRDMNDHHWAIILAAGEGSRIRHFMKGAEGQTIPKHSCPMDGRRTMLDWSIERASKIVSRTRLLVIVADQHRIWWEGKLKNLPRENLVVQPANRGTAIGVLLPLLAVLRRDPEALIVVFPSDHFVEHEEVLRSAIDRALGVAEHDTTSAAVLLGMVPGTNDPEYGWILPGARRKSAAADRVAAFVEKPGISEAARLREQGALINSFILAARARGLFGICEASLPRVASSLARVDPRPTTGDGRRELARLYDRLPCSDFSREVLASHPGLLSVVPVPDCGWSDLGPPERRPVGGRWETVQRAMQSDVTPLRVEVSMKEKSAETPRSTNSVRGKGPQVTTPQRDSAVTPEERRRMIAERAYYRAESRGFQRGQPDQDWLEAESEIDQLLASTSKEA